MDTRHLPEEFRKIVDGLTEDGRVGGLSLRELYDKLRDLGVEEDDEVSGWEWSASFPEDMTVIDWADSNGTLAKVYTDPESATFTITRADDGEELEVGDTVVEDEKLRFSVSGGGDDLVHVKARFR